MREVRRILVMCVVAAFGLTAAPAVANHGALDPNFGGGDGIRIINYSDLSGEDANAVVRQSDGRLVTGGTASDASGLLNFVLVRLNYSGSIDTSFGSNGRRVARFTGADSILESLIRLSGDRLLAAGYVPSSSGSRFALVQFTSGGNVDPAFASDGFRSIAFPPSGSSAEASDVTVQPDGKIVVAGRSIPPGGRGSFALARLNPDGETLDTSFGSGGRVITQLSPSFGSGAEDVFVQSDGKIVVLGFASDSAGDKIAVVRYNPNGTLDPTFASGGVFVHPFAPDRSERPAQIVRRSDGKYVLTGEVFRERFLVARLSANGVHEAGFTVGFGTDTGVFGDAMLLGSDGDVLMAGGVFPQTIHFGAENSQFALARLNSNGTLDLLFGGDGRVVTNLSTDTERIQDLTAQPDGFVVAGGSSFEAVTSGGVTRHDGKIAVARYHGINDEQRPRCKYRPRRKGRHRVRIRVRCNEAARVRLRVKLRGRKAVRRTLRFRRPGSKKTTVRTRATIAKGSRVGIRARARDTAGNISRKKLRRKL